MARGPASRRIASNKQLGLRRFSPLGEVQAGLGCMGVFGLFGLWGVWTFCGIADSACELIPPSPRFSPLFSISLKLPPTLRYTTTIALVCGC